MSSYESLMKGTKFGPVIVPGSSLTSALNMLVEGRADPSIKMPHGKERAVRRTRPRRSRSGSTRGAKNN
ncbi:MAG: hypothetical protein MZV65_34635 [Chromatiales bacterium]|nr:hypothetical protein [Chromatiales bacterium]